MSETPERTIILGTGALANALAIAMSTDPAAGYALVGAVAESGTRRGGVRGCRLLGAVEDLPRIVDAVAPERIVVALETSSAPIPEWLLAALVYAGIAVDAGADVYERLTGKVAIESLTPDDFLFARQLRSSPLSLRVERGISWLTAFVGLVVAAPLLVLVAAAIRLDSAGPVFFLQERVGIRGTRFRLVKFRTMDARSEARSEWAGDNGDRITRVGAWLRRYRLDELPQFLNVLRGEMNIVGPRPHPVSSSELVAVLSRNAPDCGSEIPYYALRSSVRPGITGWAQVRYKYANGLDEEVEKLRYDLYYVKHRSLALDLRIVLETFKVVTAGRVEQSIRSLRRAPRLRGRRSEPSVCRPDSRRGCRPPVRPAADCEEVRRDPQPVDRGAVAPPAQPVDRVDTQCAESTVGSR